MVEHIVPASWSMASPQRGDLYVFGNHIVMKRGFNDFELSLTADLKALRVNEILILMT